MKGYKPNSSLTILAILFFTGPVMILSSHAQQESYLQYVERINSIKHILQPGEELSKLLETKGYTDIYSHQGALNQTYWKNGLRANEPEKMKPGTLILLPYVDKAVLTTIEEANSELQSKPIPRQPAFAEIENTFSPEESPSTDKSFLPQSRFLALLGYDFFRVDAVDKQSKDTATLVSEASPKLALNWELYWSKKWSAELGFLYRQEKLKNDSKSTRTLDKISYSRINASFGLNKIWSETNRTQLFIARSERGFLRAESATVLKFDSGTSTDFGLKHEIISFRRKTASAGLEFLAAYLGAAETGSYSAETGHLARGTLFMRHQMKNFLIEGRGSYSVWKQDSPYVTQDSKEVGTSLSIGWLFE